MKPALAALGLTLALASGQAARAGCAPGGADLRSPAGTVHFSVEIADTGAERAKGLMFRDSMATMAGMLFVYDSPRPVSFWMKNTLIPLDMIFIDPTGTVTRVHENAVPGDLRPVDGGNGVQFVLEVNGGLTRKLGIAKGSVLRHPAIAQDRAAWRCD
ncbi:DUF192 domain-containing protein [Paragemmobacter straminiformis]|uniref:DUF192 domain-containing protein n=1 Tax=Paragemmobacter straminiformis TaxID=2045119 RepID=A0A842I8J8_9RHOB|nr:DUF192 domain-containing protein [Gemmobacter straminiformis]MBC2835687.1 DUF192 domain-containing protein [Gemmobacter straminiformis]